MALTLEDKTQIITTHKTHNKDTGSPEVQVALVTERIDRLQAHLQIHRHDEHSRRGLLQLVGKRRRLLKYLMKKDTMRYKNLISRLKLK